MVNDEEGYSKELESTMHKTIKKVTDDFEKMKFNTAIATMMSLVNDFYKQESVTKGEYRTLITLLNPVAPHMTEELWEMYGNGGILATTAWPEFDEAKTIDDEIEVVLQINGKIRDKIMVPNGASREDMESLALGSDKVKELTDGKTVVKVICVPGKLVNIVIK